MSEQELQRQAKHRLAGHPPCPAGDPSWSGRATAQIFKLGSRASSDIWIRPRCLTPIC